MKIGNTKIIGIDLALGKTGIAILDVPSYSPAQKCPKYALHLLDCGKGKKRMEDKARLFYIRDSIRDLLKTGVKFGAIEGYAFGSIGRAKSQLAEIGGIVRMELYEHLGQFWEIPPSQVKGFVGAGNAEKEDVYQNLKYWFQVDIQEDNLADAYIIAKIAQLASAKRIGATISPEHAAKFQSESAALARLRN